MTEVRRQSERSWFPSGPVATTMGIAAVAAITAGLLAVSDIGDDESSAERIDRAAEQLARSFLNESPEFCEQFDDAFEFRTGCGDLLDVVVVLDESALGDPDLTPPEWIAVTDRMTGELRWQCEERSR